MEVISEMSNFTDNMKELNSFMKDNGIIYRKYSKENSLIMKDKNRDDHKSWKKFCRGLIINPTDNSILAVPPVKSKECSKDEFFNEELNDSLIIQELVEGTMINMYYHNNQWNYSTRSSIGLKNKWDNKKSFHEMLQDCDKIQTDFMDKELNYSFVLRHINNRIVTPVYKNELILVEIHKGSENVSLLKCREVVQKICETNGFKDLGFTFVKQFKTTNYDDLDKLFHFENNYHLKGFTIKDFENNLRYKWINPSYKFVEDLKVNTNNKCMGYLSLRKNGNLKEYFKYFPEDRHSFDEYREKFRSIVDKLFVSYHRVFVHKNMERKEVDYALKPLLNELHKSYLNSKKPTTYNTVKEYFHNLPVKKIQFVMNYY